MEKHYWFAHELCWKVNTEAGWIEQNPPRPSWAQNQNDVPPLQFIEIWAQAASLNEIKKHLFWCDLNDIKAQAEALSQWLEAQGYEALPERTLREDALLNPQELHLLEEKGLITKAIKPAKTSPAEEPYDPLRQHQHIQVSEGGGMRFSARH